jgi:hypothetical protein
LSQLPVSCLETKAAVCPTSDANRSITNMLRRLLHAGCAAAGAFPASGK